MTKPVIFNQPRQEGDATPQLLERKKALRKKLRQAFVVAVALPVAALSAHHLIENKDPETNLEKPGPVLTFKEIFDLKSFEQEGPQESSRRRLDKIQAKMAKTDMGREILEYIKANKVTLGFYDPSIQEENSRLKEGKLGTYFADRNTIKLNPQSPDDAVMVTLAHEARHVWQMHSIKHWKITSTAASPMKKLLFGRYIEADAFAYQTAFALEHESKTGERLRLGRDIKQDEYNGYTDAEMRDRLRQDLVGGMPPEQARLNVLRLGFEAQKDRFYDRNAVMALHKDVDNALQKTSPDGANIALEEKLKAAQDAIAKNQADPDWHATISHLRKFGNMGLGKNDTNYLSGVPDMDLVSLEWMGNLSDVRAPEFKEILSKYAAMIKNSEMLLCGVYPIPAAKVPPHPPSSKP